MTTANKITIARILLVPVFVALLLYYTRTGLAVYKVCAVITFLLCAVTDALDGFIARRFDQRSELGALLDPLADKLLLVSAVVFLSFDHTPHLYQLPLWFAATVVGRDALMFLGWLVINHVCGRVTIRPRLIGKLATVLQMFTVCWLLVGGQGQFMELLVLFAGVTTGVAGLFYVWDGLRQLGASPSSKARSSDVCS